MAIQRILAVYRTSPVMVAVEMQEGLILELSLHEVADLCELVPPQLWQELVQRYQVFQIA